MSLLIIILLVTGFLISVMCGLWMLVLGFQRHWGWGVAMLIPVIARLFNLLPSPGGIQHLQAADYSLQLASLVIYVSFLVVAWPDTKPPFFWQLSAWLLVAL